MDRLYRATGKRNVTAPIIVDFQCFKNNDNEFILKEVCVLEAVSGTLLMHHIVKPPFDRDLLTDEKLRESYWLTKHCHGLNWDQGDIHYNVLEDKLRSCISKRSTVYVKGDQKKEFVRCTLITDFCTTNVIDVSDSGCGSIKSINNLLSTNTVRCRHHKTIDTRCALSNCISLRSWLFLSAKIDDDDENYPDGSYFCSCFRTITSTTTTAAAVGYDTVE